MVSSLRMNARKVSKNAALLDFSGNRVEV